MALIFCVAFASIVGQIVFNVNSDAYIHYPPTPAPTPQPNTTDLYLLPEPTDTNASLPDVFVLLGFHK